MVAISRVGSNMRFSCFSGPIRKQVLWENNKKKKVDGLSSVNRSVIAVVVKQAEEKLHTLNASLLNNLEV